MWTVAIKTNGKIAVMAQDAKARRKVLSFQPLIKFPALANFFSMLCSAAVDMVYGKKFNSRFTTTSALAAIVFYEKLSFLLALIAAPEISLFPVVSCPGVFDLGVSLVFFGVLFGIRFLPSRVDLPIAFLAGYS